MTDVLFMEELLKLCSSTVKPRLIHKKGVGAYGKFWPYMSMSDYTTADFLQNTDQVTPVFARFSKAFGKDGGADTARDVVGFAVKFYTQEGDWDLICQNMPVYFTNSGKKFPSLIRAMCPAKDTNIADSNGIWSFVTENPEAIHMALWLFSDRGTMKSYRNIEGFSSYTLIWTNIDEKQFLVRLKWEPLAGVRYITRQEAEFLAGFDPEIATCDLQNAIANEEYPAYELLAQILPIEEKDLFNFEATDPTLLWPDSIVPYVKVGKMVLDSLPKDYQNEVEKSVFSPVSRIGGIALCENDMTEAMTLVFAMDAAGRGGNR